MQHLQNFCTLFFSAFCFIMQNIANMLKRMICFIITEIHLSASFCPDIFDRGSCLFIYGFPALLHTFAFFYIQDIIPWLCDVDPAFIFTSAAIDMIDFVQPSTLSVGECCRLKCVHFLVSCFFCSGSKICVGLWNTI